MYIAQQTSPMKFFNEVTFTYSRLDWFCGKVIKRNVRVSFNFSFIEFAKNITLKIRHQSQRIYILCRKYCIDRKQLIRLIIFNSTSAHNL